MLEIKSLGNQRSIGINTSEGILEVQGKVGRRIHKLMGLDATLCQKYTSWKRRKNNNCFLTANYIAFGNTKGIGKLKSVRNGKYRISNFHTTGNIESMDDEYEVRLPLYGIALNPNGAELHAFIIIGETEDDYICFHQRGNSGVYEAITLNQIKRDWKRTSFHRLNELDSYAKKYVYVNI